MRNTGHSVARTSFSPLSAFGNLDTCRAVMRAYRLYRYYLYKEKYENYVGQD